MIQRPDIDSLRETLYDTVPVTEAASVLDEVNSSSLIEVTQLPEITQRLYLVKAQIEQAVAISLAMEVTEDNRKAAKDQLAALRKGIKALDDQRLAVRRQVLKPYDAMEVVYCACVTDVWKPAEAQLAGRITEIEDSLIEKKRSEVEPYFNELCAAHGLDFLSLDDTGVKINLTNTVKSNKTVCKSFVERVLEDLNMLSTHGDRAAEMLVEYKRNGFIAQRAVIDVNRRLDAIEQERARQEQLALQRQQEAARTAEAEEAAAEYAPLEAPVQEPVPDEEPPAVDDDPVMTVSFKATAPKSKLIRLREFMKQEGITYGNP